MFLSKRHFNKIFIAFIIVVMLSCSIVIFCNNINQKTIISRSTIKWMSFDTPAKVLDEALKVDIESFNSGKRINWISILAYMAAKYGGNFSRFKQKDITALVDRIKGGETIEDITITMKNYPHYY